MSGEEIAQRAADAVREAIAAAERRGEEIVRAATAEAERIRAEASAEAERIRAEARAETPDPRPPNPVPDPPVPHPDPTPPGDPVPDPPAPEPVPPAPTPPNPEPTPGLAANGAPDDAAARLLAMKLALDGAGRDEIAAELDSRFGPADRGALIDAVLARAGGRPASA